MPGRSSSSSSSSSSAALAPYQAPARVRVRFAQDVPLQDPSFRKAWLCVPAHCVTLGELLPVLREAFLAGPSSSGSSAASGGSSIAMQMYVCGYAVLATEKVFYCIMLCCAILCCDML
jgi:hypothetical protein